MALTTYEGLFILDPSKYAADPAGTSGEVEKILTDAGAELLVSRLFEERKLSYPINGFRKGTYWLIYFNMESSDVPNLDRKFRITEAILRQMIISIEPRLVEALVTHAGAGESATPAPVGQEKAEPVADLEDADVDAVAEVD